ncbi:SDR family NAD(P)-dependent oxidoreductase [Microbacterium sp. KHB019]|uniref:SDR family NAD(P)-dependent oxidoreductase n=1 Tax=Microbacterium sp. KHB019 TaxID=3129770 RepID=UPI003FCF5F74
MELQLNGRRAFVSGSTQGIGFTIARGLLAEGASVVINGRDRDRVDRALRDLKAGDPDAPVSGIVADVADPRQVQRMLDELGEVDILVNNVGLFELSAFGDIDDEDWQRYFDVNVMSGVRLSRGLLPRMLDRGWGRIVFIGTESGVNVPADMVHYGVTKAAALALSNGLAKLTRGTGVTVNTILGGPTYSGGDRRARALPGESALIRHERRRSARRWRGPHLGDLSAPRSGASWLRTPRGCGGLRRTCARPHGRER